MSGQNGQRVLTIELRAVEGGEAASGILILPFGLRLDDGVTLTIDENAALPTLRFSTCLPAGYLVPLTFDAATVSALRAGGALVLTAVANDTDHEVSFSISLAGFTSVVVRAAELNNRQIYLGDVFRVRVPPFVVAKCGCDSHARYHQGFRYRFAENAAAALTVRSG